MNDKMVDMAIAHFSGAMQVWRGFQSGDYPGLAITPVARMNIKGAEEVPGRWQITHIKSGGAIGPSSENLDTLRMLAVELSAQCDFTQDAEPLLKDCKAAGIDYEWLKMRYDKFS